MAIGLNYAYWDSVGSDDDSPIGFHLNKEKLHDLAIILYNDYSLNDEITEYLHPQLVHRRYLFRVTHTAEMPINEATGYRFEHSGNADFNLIGAAIGIEFGVFDGYLLEIDYLRHPNTGFSTWELALGFF